MFSEIYFAQIYMRTLAVTMFSTEEMPLSSLTKKSGLVKTINKLYIPTCKYSKRA